MWKRFDTKVRRVVTAALRDAAARGRDVAGPEHLLAAMDERSAVVVEQQQPRLPRSPQPPRPYADRFDDAAMRALRDATALAGRRLNVTIDHLRCGLVRHLDGAFASTLPDELRAASSTWRPTLAQRALDTGAGEALARAARATLQVWNTFVHSGLGHPAYTTNPYPLYRKLRRRSPVRRDPNAPLWVVTSYEHTLTTLRDPRFNKDPFVAERLPRGAREQLGMSDSAGARSSAENISMLFLDPPDHTRVRSIFTSAFTPRTLEAMRRRIHEICDEQVALMGQQGDATDLISTLAYPLPVMVIAELLGFPRADYQKLKTWSDDMAAALGFVPSEEDKLRAARARDEMRAYFFEHIVPRLRRAPDDSLLSRLLELESRGQGLNEDELFSNSVLLLAAGHETTTGLIGNGVLALLQHPDQLALLRDDPSLIGSAVDELLRFDPPVQWTTRVAGVDLELGGQRICKGDLVLSTLGAANRDPKVFADPDLLDIRRKDNRHLAFGSGIHFCLGAALARMEAEIAIGTLIARYPNVRLATPARKLRWRKGTTFRGLEALPLKLQ